VQNQIIGNFARPPSKKIISKSKVKAKCVSKISLPWQQGLISARFE